MKRAASRGHRRFTQPLDAFLPSGGIGRIPSGGLEVLGTLENAFLVEPSGGYNISPPLMSLGIADGVLNCGTILNSKLSQLLLKSHMVAANLEPAQFSLQ